MTLLHANNYRLITSSPDSHLALQYFSKNFFITRPIAHPHLTRSYCQRNGPAQLPPGFRLGKILHRMSSQDIFALCPVVYLQVHITVGPKNLTSDQVTLRIDPNKHRYTPMDSNIERPGDRIKSVSLTEWGVDVPFVRRGLSGPTGSGNYYSNGQRIIFLATRCYH